MLHDYDIQALVVDDMATMRAMLKVQLRAIGVENIKEASNAATALDKLREGGCNLCVIDYYLGDATDGQQLLDYIRTERLVSSSAVVCMVTAETKYGPVAKVAEHSPDAYLIKPFTADKLAETLLPLFERKFGIRQLNKSSPGLKPLYDQFDTGNYRAVLALADALIGKEGIKSDVARLKGEALLAMGDIAEALAFFETIADRYAWAALGVAKAQTQLHDTKRAIGVLENLVQHAPLYVHAVDLLAEAYIADAQKERALPLLEAACQKSPTVSRMRLTAQIAERIGQPATAAKWAEKTVASNKHAVTKDPLDYARHVRNLARAGQPEKALAALVAYENEAPSLKTEGAILAARAIALTGYIEQEEERFQSMPEGLRERRLGMLRDSRAKRDALVAQVKAMPADGQTAVYLSEALLAAGDVEGSEMAALAAAKGAYLPQDMPARAASIGMLLEKYKAQSLEGLKMIKEGRFREALRHFMALSEQAPMEMAPQLLANVVLAVVSLNSQAQSIQDELPLAKAAFQRLKRQYPNYERLESVEKSFQPLLK